MGKKRRKRSLSTYSNIAKHKRRLETPEQKELRLTQIRIRAAERRASESVEDRTARLALARQRITYRRNQLKIKAKSVNLSDILEKINSANSQSEVRTLLDKLDKKQRIAYEAYTQLKAEREACAKRAAERRSQETPEERARRLEQGRIRVAMTRAKESEEEREDRLARLRTQLKKHREFKKLQNTRISGAYNNCNTYSNYLIAVTQSLNKINTRTKMTSMYSQAVPTMSEQDRLKPSHIAQLYQHYQAYMNFQATYALATQEQISNVKLQPESSNGASYMPNDDDSSTIDVAPVECEVLIEEGNSLGDNVPSIKEEISETSVSCDQLEIEKKETGGCFPKQNRLGLNGESLFEEVFCKPEPVSSRQFQNQ